MILSHKHKFILFCNPKTGSTSLEKTLEPYQEGQEYNYGVRQFNKGEPQTILFPNKHIPPLLLKAWLPKEIWDSYYKIVFVRNPWDWVVSEWKYHFKLKKVSVMDLIKEPVTTARYLKNYQHKKRLNNKQVFTVEDIDYLFDHLKRWFPVTPSASGLHQSHYVYDLDGNQIVDFVGRFENLEADFELIKEKLDLDISLPHLNRTKRNRYKTYFTEDSNQRVAQLWKKDIDNFGYKFNCCFTTELESKS